MTFPEFLSYAITAIVLGFLIGLVMLPLAMTWRIWVITRERIHSRQMEAIDKEIELEKAKQIVSPPVLETPRSTSTNESVAIDGLTEKGGA